MRQRGEPEQQSAAERKSQHDILRWDISRWLPLFSVVLSLSSGSLLLGHCFAEPRIVVESVVIAPPLQLNGQVAGRNLPARELAKQWPVSREAIVRGAEQADATTLLESDSSYDEAFNHFAFEQTVISDQIQVGEFDDSQLITPEKLRVPQHSEEITLGEWFMSEE